MVLKYRPEGIFWARGAVIWNATTVGFARDSKPRKSYYNTVLSFNSRLMCVLKIDDALGLFSLYMIELINIFYSVYNIVRWHNTRVGTLNDIGLIELRWQGCRTYILLYVNWNYIIYILYIRKTSYGIQSSTYVTEL